MRENYNLNKNKVTAEYLSRLGKCKKNYQQNKDKILMGAKSKLRNKKGRGYATIF